ncbi:MAG TPA: hypothetical protein VNV41_19795 [Candidatus Acidoferrales bacterium]|jgi:hypothetical protein|nr:hypothetical protein [Candidatus Acidoferrales bacterium]
MKNYKVFASALALATMLALSASAARAQAAEAAAATVVAPIVTKIFNVVTPHSKPAGSNWLKAEVIHADAQTIIVREQKNGMAIHTFNFSPEMKDKMQAILDNGGFQYGDKVGILFMPGQTVALRIHGKPSKSL